MIIKNPRNITGIEYWTIYNRMKRSDGITKLKYFCEWNRGIVESKDLVEYNMFDYSDLYYIGMAK